MIQVVELLILLGIFGISITLIHKSFDAAIKVLLVLSVLLHKEVFSIYHWDYLPVRFFMLGLLLYCVFRFVLWYSKTRSISGLYEHIKNPFFLTLCTLWLVRLISIINTKNLPASILILGFFTTVIALGILLWNHLHTDNKKTLDFIKFYINVVFVLCIFGYFQLGLYHYTGVIIGALWNVPGHISRVGSTFWDVNHFGALLALLLPVLGVLIITEGTLKQRAVRSAMFLTMIGILVLTSSRTAWIAALISFATFVSILLLKRFGKKGLIGLSVFILVISVAAGIEYSDKSSPFRAYVKQNFHYRLDSFASHLYLLTGSYQIFEENPIIGGGYGSFFEHFRITPISSTFFSRDPAALNTRVPAHTIWGELISETGVLGLASFVAFLIVLYAPLSYIVAQWSNLRTSLLSSAMLSAITGSLVAGIFYSYNSEFFWLVLFLYFLYGVSLLPCTTDLNDVVQKVLLGKGMLLVSIALISLSLIFVNLGATHLIPWDEAIYAKIAKNMVAASDYVSMEWQPNKVWFEKPPLGMWLQALALNIFGLSSFASRFFSAVFGFMTVLVVYAIGKKLFSKEVGFIASLSLITTVHFLQYSRYAMLDVTLTFFITLSIYLYMRAQEGAKMRYWILSGISVGLAVMTKGVVGLLPLVIIGVNELYLLVTKQTKFSKKAMFNYVVFGISTLCIFLPWHLEMYHRYGYEFIHSYLIYHVFDRALEAIEDKGQPWNWYFEVLRVSMRTWYVALIGALPLSLYLVYKKNKQHVLLVLWAIIIFVFFSVAQSKVVWYIVPIYPALSLIVGYFVHTVMTWVANHVKNVLKINYTQTYYLGLYVLTIFSLCYLFFNRELVYTSDLTGSKARLLQLKDKELDTDSLLYVHSIEEPLVLYYTDSPFAGFDFSVKHDRIPTVEYDQQLILLTKRGRFPGYDVPVYGKLPKVVGEDGDYILWYYDSTKEVDKDEIKGIDEQLNMVSAQTVNRADLLQRKQLLEQRILSNGAKPAN